MDSFEALHCRSPMAGKASIIGGSASSTYTIRRLSSLNPAVAGFCFFRVLLLSFETSNSAARAASEFEPAKVGSGSSFPAPSSTLPTTIG